MAKGLYLGSSNLARKVKKLYIGNSNNLASKVKKMYVGDANGIARNCLSGGTPAYYGKAADLSIRRCLLNATSAEGYALFAGGMESTTTASGYVDYYMPSLTKGYATSLSSSRCEMGATSLGNLAFFGGGTNDPNSTSTTACFSTVDVYELPSFTHSNTPQGVRSSWGLGAGSVGNYAVFVGGRSGSSGYYSRYNAFDASLTRQGTGVEQVTEAHGNGVGCTTIGNYLLAGGGYAGHYVDAVDIIDASLTVQTPLSFTVGMPQPCAETVDNRAIFINQGSSEVNMFDSSLTRIVFASSSNFPANGASAVLDDFVLIGGGTVNNSDYKSQMLAVSSAGTLQSLTNLSEARAFLAATVVGEFAIFAGGKASRLPWSWNADVYYLE